MIGQASYSLFSEQSQPRNPEGSRAARGLLKKAWFRKALVKPRQVWRCLRLTLWLLVCALDFILLVGAKRNRTSAARRVWLSRAAQGALNILGVDLQVEGRPPTHGILISNHLGYLDIVVLAAVAHSIFVSKHEVRNWPVFGWFAQCAGTIFVDRSSRRDVGRVAQEMEAALDRGALVALFPEGTSSNGESVLPFRSSLLEPLRSPRYLTTLAALDYQVADGDVGTEVCYWGDHELAPHLLRLMGKKRIKARVRFSSPRCAMGSDRKVLAHSLRECVMRLREKPGF